MLSTLDRANFRRAAIYSLGLTGIWILVAAWRPEVTYHLAPLLVAAVPPIAVTVDEPGHVDRRSLLIAATAGLGLSVAATALLSGLGWLSGPSLLPAGGAATEALVFAFVGAIAGTVVAVVRTSR
jgi:hypothetical protein